MEFFMADGRHVASLSLAGLTANWPNVAPVGRFEDGRFLVQPEVGYSAPTRRERPYFLVDLKTARLDTLGVGRIEHGSMVLSGITGSNSSFVGANPLARKDQGYVDPNGRFAVMLDQTMVVRQSHERFELVKTDAAGNVTWRKLFELPFARDVRAVVMDIVDETVRTATIGMSDQLRQNFQERVYRDELQKALVSVGDRAGPRASLFPREWPIVIGRFMPCATAISARSSTFALSAWAGRFAARRRFLNLRPRLSTVVGALIGQTWCSVRSAASAPTEVYPQCPSSGWMLFDVYEPSGTYLGLIDVAVERAGNYSKRSEKAGSMRAARRGIQDANATTSASTRAVTARTRGSPGVMP
jgi:hypothetical protein